MDFGFLTLAAVPGWLSTVGYIALVLVGFSMVIFVHELGHFLVAKKVGIRVERFALGFGPRLFGLKVGETDYCINALPLGGYVKMSGQEDFKLEKEPEPDPRAYNNKSVGARMAVVSAGVIMNIIFAIIGFMVVFMVGIQSPSNRVGQVQFNSPAYGKIEPGDTMLMIDGNRTRDAVDVTLEAALSGGDSLQATVQSPGGQISEVTLNPKSSRELEGLPAIGTEPEGTLRLLMPEVVEGMPDLPARKFMIENGLEEGDHIVRAAGQPVEFYSDLVRIMNRLHGQPFDLVVEGQRDGKPFSKTVTITPTFPGLSDVRGDALNLLGGHPRLEISAVTPQGAAAGKLEPGDVVLRFGEKSDPNFGQWADAANANADKPVQMVIDRDGEQLTVEVTPDYSRRARQALVGVGLTWESDQAILGFVEPESAMSQAGLASGAAIVGVSGPNGSAGVTEAAAKSAQPLTWSQLYRGLLDNVGQTARLVYRYDGQLHTAELAVPPADQWARQIAFSLPSMPLEIYKVEFTAGGNPALAAWMGIERTWRFMKQAYVTIDRLITSKNFGLRHATGPVGIAMVSFRYAREGWVDLLYFLSLISANLAVINFLPLPIVDGGLFTFLVIEKIRKKPVSVRVQQISQIVGIVLIISLFIAVTWYDLLRFVLPSNF